MQQRTGPLICGASFRDGLTRFAHTQACIDARLSPRRSIANLYVCFGPLPKTQRFRASIV
jgi:hypothetical protein